MLKTYWIVIYLYEKYKNLFLVEIKKKKILGAIAAYSLKKYGFFKVDVGGEHGCALLIFPSLRTAH